MKKIIFVLSIALFSSCTQKQDSTTVETANQTDVQDTLSVTETTSVLDGEHCWIYAHNKDTTQLQLTFSGNDFSGKLIYDNYQKDGSFGFYEGKLHGDTLIGNYRMMSEGMVSDLEKIYLLQDGKLDEGIGPMQDDGSDYKMVFVSYDSVKFGELRNFEKTECSTDFISKDYDPFWENLK